MTKELSEFEQRFGVGWKRVWVEDDALPHDRELSDEAWFRLFGESRPDLKTADDYFDGGDADFYRFGNRMLISSYPGDSEIRVLEGGKDGSEK